MANKRPHLARKQTATEILNTIYREERVSKKDKQQAAKDREYRDIQREIICEQYEMGITLMESQHSLLRALIDAEERLILYRKQRLDWLDRHLPAYKQGVRCVPGCTKHAWDDKEGWYRR